MTALASRYKGRIRYYEIWNEWNVALYWKGTPAQLVRMAQDARCVVVGPERGCNPQSSFPGGVAIDPAARMVTPSPVGGHTKLSAVADQLSAYSASNGGTFADVIGFHTYVATPAGVCPLAEDVSTVLGDLDATLARYPAQTANKPLFNTEGGWSKADVEGFDDPNEQAAFLARYYLLQESHAVARVYWYLWDSPTANIALWNATTKAISPAGTAYGEVYRWLSGATLVGPCTASGTIWTCEFTRPGGYGALAAWDAAKLCNAGVCTTSSFTQPTGRAYHDYRELSGRIVSIAAGSTAVPIRAKPILLETGPA